MTREIRVLAKSDHVASLSNASPLAAIEELVWNALDADAREVKIDPIVNALGAVEQVRISDNGTGIDVPRVEETFGSLGGSWKMDRALTSLSRRRLHGRHGRGRFKAFGIGTRVEWRTTRARPDGGFESWCISGDIATPGLFQVEDAEPGFASGTEVLISNARATADCLTDAGACVSALAAKFAPYLKSYPDVRIYFAGIPVTPVIVEKNAATYKITTENGAEAKLEVIEWRRRFVGAGRLNLCGKDGFALRDEPAGVRPGAGFSFTAYLSTPRFDALDAENALVMDELHPEVRAYLDAARRILRDHFRVRAAEMDSARLAGWIAEGSYPFTADDASEKRVAFDAAVADMRTHLEGLDAVSPAERKYLFLLLLKSLEV